MLLSLCLWPGLSLAAADLDLDSALTPTAHRPRLVHVWASWCTPCVAELPALISALRPWSARVDVVFISLDEHDKAGEAARLLKHSGVLKGQTIYPGMKAIPRIQAFDPEWDGSIPTTYVWSSDGRLTKAQRGFTDFSEIIQLIKRRP